MNRFQIFYVAIAAAVAVASAEPAQSYLIFFDEDLNNQPTPFLNESTPLLSAGNDRSSAFPNASAAESAFLSFLVGTGTETFEDIPEGTEAPLVLTFPGAGLATLSGSTGEVVTNFRNFTNNGFGRYGVTVDGGLEHFWKVRAGAVTGDFIITFSEDVAAFGFWGIDLGDFGGELELLIGRTDATFTLETVMNTIGSGGSTGGSVVFWGIIAEEGDPLIESVDFLTNVLQPNDFKETFAFDDFTIGSREQVRPPIPEPATAILLGIGVVCLGVSRRRPR